MNGFSAHMPSRSIERASTSRLSLLVAAANVWR